MFAVLGLMKHGKVLRGTPLDPFGGTAHRKRERRLITEYEATVDELWAGLTSENRDTAVAIASILEQIRGFDLVEEIAIFDAGIGPRPSESQSPPAQRVAALTVNDAELIDWTSRHRSEARSRFARASASLGAIRSASANASIAWWSRTGVTPRLAEAIHIAPSVTGRAS